MLPRPLFAVPALLGSLALAAAAAPKPPEEKLFTGRLNVNPPHVSTDPSVKYDYDIVYVRARRAGDKVHKRYYTDIATPVTLEPGADLVLLHPDGKEELLVAGGDGAITDPSVSFDGEWVFYTRIHSLKGAGPWQPPPAGADVYKIHVKSRKVVRLTHQQFTPNTGAADWSSDCRRAEPGKTHLSYGVLNFGAYPLPGGRVVFTSNRNAFVPPRGYPRVALQLFVMDDDGGNVEQIGHLNVAGALHPVVMRDGRIMFSSLESQGARGEILWGIWTIHPDGTRWAPLVSAFDPGGAPNAFHFQTQLSDGSLVIEGYYNLNNSGFGTYIKLPEKQPYPAFGPAHVRDPRNKPWRMGRFDNGKGKWYRMPFMPLGSLGLTPFARIDDGPADRSVLGDKTSPAVGKFTHPCGAPDNHLLTVWSPGPANHQYTHLPQIDGGIYLLKGGQPIDEPGRLLLIKNDPNYNEQWPRALVPYKRIYGVDEPKRLPALANDGRLSPHLPEGTPFGLVGTSSLYKRESYPNGAVPAGKVTAGYAGGNDPWRGLDAFTSHGNGMPLNWHNQGGDAGLYSNDAIHAVRILAMEPTTDRNRGPRSGRLFHSHANERLRVLGEIPVRKFAGGKQPLDPDGNPDTSFLARIPADTAFTFQTLDKDGMVLNMAQTWHQLRPGEVRTDCGGCHAHSQEPTPFEKTAAARADYKVWDLVNQTPLLTGKARDESGRRWDEKGEAGLAFAKGVKSVEYHRDVRPILERSCVACHTAKGGKPAGNLDLDAPDETYQGRRFPGAYYRLALDEAAKYGHRPVGWPSWGYPQASRYVRKFQSRRSLLVWKIHGKRLDGFANDDHPSETTPGSGTLAWKGQPVDVKKYKARADLDFVGSVMPPPEAVAGTYAAPDGRTVKVAPLSDEDRRTLVRWIDLGCPIDLDYHADYPEHRGHGWMCDDNRPVLRLTEPRPGDNKELSRLLVGMHDYYSGLDMKSFHVVADFPIDGAAAGTDLAPRFRQKSQGVWELKLGKPVTDLPRGRLSVSVQDRQGNVSRVERTFSVGRARGSARGAERPPTPVLIDTDVADDIDDAFALGLALVSPELEVRGITTVAGDAWTRARIVCRLLHEVGRDTIPVAAGRPPQQTPTRKGQFAYSLRPGLRKQPLKERAVEFLYSQLKARPGELTLVAIGPLTNIAELYARHPDCKPWVKRLVVMGGAVRVGYNGKPPPGPEWNVKSDVKAAQAVFASGVPLLVVPVDAAIDLKLIEARRRRVFGAHTALTEQLEALYKLSDRPTPTLFDPLAVALCFDERWCKVEALRLEVDGKGLTRVVPGKPNARVATSTRSEEYLDWFVARLAAAGGKEAR